MSNLPVAQASDQRNTYARLSFDEAEFQLTLGSVKASRAICFNRWIACTAQTNPKEVEFYRDRVAEYDRLILRLEAVLLADKSQDAEDSDEEDED